MRALVAASAGDLPGLRRALAAALSGEGPAILVAEAGEHALIAEARAALLAVPGVSASVPGVSASGSAPAFPPALPSPPAPVPLGEVEDAIAVILSTSGSTGIPKRIAHSAEGLEASARATEAALGGAGAWVLALSAHTIAGLQTLVRAALAGTEVIALPTGHIDPAALAAASRAARASGGRAYTSLVPAQLGRLLDTREGEAALAGFDAVLVGGQALPAPVAARAAAAGIAVVRTYGSSETGGGCVYDGIPLPGVEARERGGELWLSAPSLALGYLGGDLRLDGAATDAAFAVEGGRRWFRTGDTAEISPAGAIRVTGRRDNVIVSGGINVSLDRVEAAVRAVPGLAEAVIVGGPDPRWGQSPVLVWPGPEADTEAALRELLAGAREAAEREVGPAGRPSRLIPLARIPLLGSGKPDRRALTLLAAAEPEAPGAIHFR